MQIRLPRRRNQNHDDYKHLRRRRRFSAWLTQQATRLLSTATAQTVTALVQFATGLLTVSANITGSAKATGLLTLTGQPLNNETVVINGKTYTFQTVLTNVDGHVLIDVDTATSLTNLINAITLGVGSGTKYASATTAITGVTVSQGAGTTMNVTALADNAAGNSITTTETLTNGSFGGATLSGGADADTVTIGSNVYRFQTVLTNTANNVLRGATAAISRDNLVAAINAAAGSGTLYAAATVVHPTVTAVASGANMAVTAKSSGTAANSIATTKVAANLSWGGATLSGGVTSNNLTATGHGITNGEGPYNITSSSTYPSPLTAGSRFWISVVDANTIAVASTKQDAIRGNVTPLSSPGSGTITISKESDKQGIYNLLYRNKPVQVKNATDIDNINA